MPWGKRVGPGLHTLMPQITSVLQRLQAAECGLWGAARNVFEHGLARHPRHALMLEKLVEVLLQLGDWPAAAPLINRILHRCSACCQYLNIECPFLIFSGPAASEIGW